MIIDLSPREDFDVLSDYHTFKDTEEECVYNDDYYSFYIKSDSSKIYGFEDIYINNETIDRKTMKYSDTFFRDCFGLIRIEVVIEGVHYITKNIQVMLSKSFVNQNLINMIDYIYNNCDDYLYETHKHSKTPQGIKSNYRVSIDSKLSLLNKIYDTYINCFKSLKYSSYAKLVNQHKIAPFNELKSINPNTIEYILNHPDELHAVNYDSGIYYNKQYYQPENTLVSSVTYSNDIYENQVIVGFLRTIINELKLINDTLNEEKQRYLLPKDKDGYTKSSYYIFNTNQKLLNDYLNTISNLKYKFEHVLLFYLSVFKVRDIRVTSLPKYTNIFRRIMPYSLIFNVIKEWFSCGDYDLTKSNLLLSFISVSKIYEYFCLLKINNSLISMGFKLVNGYKNTYDDAYKYLNTTYNNTFDFEKNDIKVTVYFQPVIYGKRTERYGIGLFRNTNISIGSLKKYNKTYSPDYLLKMQKNQESSSYYILDAKHSKSERIKRDQLANLVFKYIFSISSLSKRDIVHGLCILCGKNENNGNENIYNVAQQMSKSIKPRADVLRLTGKDVDNSSDLIKLLNDYVYE